MAGLNVLTYLIAYLDACGRNGGKPLAGPGLERFLPWAADPTTCPPGRSRPRPANPAPPPPPPRRGVTVNTVTPPASMPAHTISENLPSESG
jgi:hypothetical protein